MILTALLAHFLIPHESNNHKARLLQPLFVALSLFLFLLTQALIPFLPRFTPVVLGYASAIPAEKIVELTNEKRGEAGSGELKIDPLLTQAALAKASDMFAQEYWAHVAPDGTEPWKFFIDAGYRYRFAGENLARDFTQADDVVSAWMASPTHKENLLSSRYQDMGVAVVDGELDGVETTLVVQLFGTKFTAEAVAAGPGVATIPQNPQATVAGTKIIPKNLLVSPFSSTKKIALFFVSLFFTLLSIDMAIINHRKVERRTSATFAHLLFFGMIILVLLASQSGLIL